MQNILDRVSQSLHAFRPTDIRQYTAFQIARQLGDQYRLRQYLVAAEEHSPLDLTKAYRRTKRIGGAPQEFFRLLNRINAPQPQ